MRRFFTGLHHSGGFLFLTLIPAFFPNSTPAAWYVRDTLPAAHLAGPHLAKHPARLSIVADLKKEIWRG